VTKLITYEHMCCAAERLLLLVAQLIHVAVDLIFCDVLSFFFPILTDEKVC